MTAACALAALSALACPGPRAASEPTIPQAQQAVEPCRTQPCSEAEIGGRENQLGFLYLNRKDAATAEQHFRSAVAHNQRAFGASDPRTMISVDNLATALTQQGKVDESLPLHREACAFFEKQAGANSGDLGICLVSLGHALAKHGDRQPALDSYKRALQIFWSRRAGSQELDVLISLMAALPPSTDRLQVSLRGQRWFLRVGELPGLRIEMDQVIAPGNHRYVFATNDRLKIGASVRLKQLPVDSARACRESEMGIVPDPKARGARVSEHGDYSEYEHQEPLDVKRDSSPDKLEHLNVFRYLIHDGVCITVHLSTEVRTPADRAVLDRIMSTVAVLGFDQLM